MQAQAHGFLLKPYVSIQNNMHSVLIFHLPQTFNPILIVDTKLLDPIIGIKG